MLKNERIKMQSDRIIKLEAERDALQARVDTAKNVEALLNDTIAGLRKELHEAQASQHQASSQITQAESPQTTAADSGHRKGQEGDTGVSTQGDYDLKARLAAAEQRVKWLEHKPIARSGAYYGNEYEQWLAAEPQGGGET